MLFIIHNNYNIFVIFFQGKFYLQNDRKKFLKEELNKIGLTIYKTDKSLNELREIQEKKELLLQ